MSSAVLFLYDIHEIDQTVTLEYLLITNNDIITTIKMQRNYYQKYFENFQFSQVKVFAPWTVSILGDIR